MGYRDLGASKNSLDPAIFKRGDGNREMMMPLAIFNVGLGLDDVVDGWSGYV
jgi:hypothetical protein